MLRSAFCILCSSNSIIKVLTRIFYHNNKLFNHKILKKCRLPLTAAGQVNMIITEMGVMEITPKGIVLTEINPEFTVEQVQAATEATLIIPDNLKQVILN